MKDVVKKPATYEDLKRVPDSKVAEILDGELYATPRPRLRHANAATVLGTEIGGLFHQGRGGPGGWWILFEPELHLGADIVVPDLAGWRRTSLPAIPDTAFLTLAPDWACEIVSPATERMDRGQKLHIYAREGVTHLWLITPIVETLEVLGLASGRWTVIAAHAGDVAVRAEPFEAVTLDLAGLWYTGQEDRGAEPSRS